MIIIFFLNMKGQFALIFNLRQTITSFLQKTQLPYFKLYLSLLPNVNPSKSHLAINKALNNNTHCQNLNVRIKVILIVRNSNTSEILNHS